MKATNYFYSKFYSVAFLFIVVFCFGCTPTFVDFQKHCVELGFTVDTPEMRNCVLQQDLAYQNSSSIAAAAILANQNKLSNLNQ